MLPQYEQDLISWYSPLQDGQPLYFVPYGSDSDGSSLYNVGASNTVLQSRHMYNQVSPPKDVWGVVKQ